MVGMLFNEKYARETYIEWYDVAIHPAAERPELLLYVLPLAR